jgi:Uncharacterized protein containing SIS (Sugar ISomerase) phosphosugar binding domain
MIEYFSKIREILDVVEKEESDNIKKAVELLTETIFNKGSIYIFGASHAGILCEEMYYRAGGLMLMNPIFAKELMLDASPVTKTSKMEQLNGYGSVIASKVGFKKGDVLIVHSVSGRNPVGIEMAILAQSVGVEVIALTNLSYSKSVTSRHDTGKNLYEYSDIIIDNHGDIGDACVKLPGLEQQVGATSTVVGATVLNSIIVETTRTLIERGMKKPPIFYSANLDGGDELNQKLFAEYKDSIHYKL